jgi:endoglycosylceramidase
LPSWDHCNQKAWANYYFSYDTGHAFNELYRKDSPLNKKFTAFWKKIAQRFKGNPYVLGYELINEPFVGNALRNIFLIIPSVAERLKFQSFYDNLAQ